MIRDAVVAGRFYPESSRSLKEQLAQLVEREDNREDIIALVSPHAGYIYSGVVAGKTFSEINVPDTVVILSPNHTGYGEPVSIMSSGKWRIPTGDIGINEELASTIKNNSRLVKENSAAHLREHSIEVQLPFIKYLNDRASIVPITIMPIRYPDCLDVGKAVAAAIKGIEGNTLIVASSDMTHYKPRSHAKEQDMLAIEKILSLDPEGLYKTVTKNNISMCGVIPATIMLIAAQILGAKSARLVDYRDSGEVNGDASSVVGYAGIIIK